MSSEEIKKELALPYQKLVGYLLDKYGPAQYDYFVNETCRTKNKKVTRSSEGLECHHIDEDKAIMLSMPKFAANNPFEYQRADRLVYCNVIEHLILHAKIVEQPFANNANKLDVYGAGGIMNICMGINDYYNGIDHKQPYKRALYAHIADNFDDYIDILVYILDLVAGKRPELHRLLNAMELSRGFLGQIIDRVYCAIYEKRLKND